MKSNRNGQLVILLLLGLAGAVGLLNQERLLGDRTAPESTQGNAPEATGFSPALRQLIGERRSGQMVTTSARVLKLLPDDTKGSQHQRFLLADTDGKTVLVAHNIDLAPRAPVRPGMLIRLRGQFEWNDRGGVLHWTHHDPRGRHAEGWIEVEGQRYE